MRWQPSLAYRSDWIESRVALGLDRTGESDAGPNVSASLRGRGQDEIGGGDGRHLDLEIDAVEQRA
jgi:hypothetical protein